MTVETFRLEDIEDLRQEHESNTGKRLIDWLIDWLIEGWQKNAAAINEMAKWINRGLKVKILLSVFIVLYTGAWHLKTVKNFLSF